MLYLITVFEKIQRNSCTLLTDSVVFSLSQRFLCIRLNMLGRVSVTITWIHDPPSPSAVHNVTHALASHCLVSWDIISGAGLGADDPSRQLCTGMGYCGWEKNWRYSIQCRMHVIEGKHEKKIRQVFLTQEASVFHYFVHCHSIVCFSRNIRHIFKHRH